MNYLNFVLTLILLLLAAIVIKIYQPASSSPTRRDFVEARKIKDNKAREMQLEYLESKLPVVWIRDGFINGDVSISGSVEVEGTVEVENNYSPLEVEIVR